MLRKLLGEIARLDIQAQGDNAGKIEDVYFDDQAWFVRYFVVNTGSWLLGRRVLIAPLAVAAPDWTQRILSVKLTKQQVQDSPDIDLEQPVTRQHLIDLHQYYDWPMFGGADPMFNSSLVSLYPSDWAARNQSAEQQTETWNRAEQSADAPANQEPGDPHLCSAQDVRHYHVRTVDGEVGHVEDFFVSEEDWIVRYLLVDSRRWLPGRKFLIAPAWIESISWADAEVRTTVTRDQVERSPEYTPAQVIERDYEIQLYHHYEVPGYWVGETEKPATSPALAPAKIATGEKQR